MLAFLHTHTATGFGAWCSVVQHALWRGCRSAERSANIHTNIILPVQAAETLCLGRFCDIV